MPLSKFASVSVFVGAAVLAAATGPGATCAFAANLGDQVTVKVDTTDLNMGSEAGARQALRRIERAAVEICGGDAVLPGADRTQGEQMQSEYCTQEVVKRTIASLNQPALTAVSEGRHVAAALAEGPKTPESEK
jgi:UrcA family protein